jgi:broad specificity phosphatase PhoE
MTQPNTTHDLDAERAQETAQARAELLRRAEEQGVRPLSFDELLGEPAAGDTAQEDVDDFLALRREWREAERARARE